MKIKELGITLKDTEYQIKRYKKEEYVAFRGDRVPGLMIILEGVLNAQMLGDNGKVQVIEKLKKNAIVASAFIFGEKNFFPVDLFTETEVQIIFVKKEKIFDVLSQNRELMEKFLNEISSKAQFLSEKLWKSFSGGSIRDKLKEYIEKHRNNNMIVIKSVKELAENFSVARPSLSRVLKEMIEEGELQRVDKNTYKIL